MEILLAGLTEFVKNWDVLLGLLAFWLLGAWIIVLACKFLSGKAFHLAEALSLGLGGGLLPVLVALPLAYVLNLGIKIPVLVLLLPLVIALGLLLARRSSKILPPSNKPPFLALIFILVFSLLLRLAFLSGLIVPPYFDSASHYDLIQGLMTAAQTAAPASLTTLNGAYYHLGFHALSAALGLALQADPGKMMLVFGQVLLVLLPLPLFFILRQVTGQDSAGLFAVLLAGWGWDMPAHALNWGKYSALASLPLLEFALCVAILLIRCPPGFFPFNRFFVTPGASPADRRKSALLLLICALSLAAATLIHTRALVLGSIFLLARVLALAWPRLPQMTRTLAFAGLLAILVVLALTLRAKPSLALVFDPYISRNSLWITLIVAILLPFALKTHPRATVTSLLAVIFSLGCLFIPIAFFAPADYQTLLDRPFVEMSLYLPLTLLGGLGYSGLLRALRETAFLQRLSPKWTVSAATILLFGAVLARFSVYPYVPSKCCQIFTETDAVAFEWMDANLPVDATVLIAAAPLYVLEASPVEKYAGSDAGVWIKPLLGRKTLTRPMDTDFSVFSARKRLCQRDATYIYIGAAGQSFSLEQIQARPGWYRRLLLLPRAQVYRIVCPPAR